MTKDSLSGYFTGIAAKRLSAVEADPETSHQHELNGITEMKVLFGDKRVKMPATFLYLDDTIRANKETGQFLTWYDAREKHPTRSEFRLYFPGTNIPEKFREGDLVIIGKLANGTAVLIAAKSGSTSEKQLIWLFNLPEKIGSSYEVKEIRDDDKKIDFASKIILEELGIEIEEETDGKLLALMIDKFGEKFPDTRTFSAFAQEVSEIEDITPDSADTVIVTWLEQEENLFKNLEKYLVSKELKKGFGPDNTDVNLFINYSLKVQNRRKSRAGLSLENHLESIFKHCNIKFKREGVTENQSTPDFLFPGEKEYHDPQFSPAKLTMLGAKTTCKDRWRQVLAEAERIKTKHLFTLEPGISEPQTAEMMNSSLQLVLPSELHKTYSVSQRKWLMDLSGFITMVKERQG